MTYSRPSRRFTTKISAKLKTKVHQNINGILPLWSFFFNKNHVCIWCTLLLLQKMYLMVTYNFAKMGNKSWNSCGVNYCFNALKPGPWFNIKMPSYQYRKSHCGGKMAARSSYFQNGNSCTVNTLRPRQNGRHFTDDTFKRIFVNENVRILIEISLKFVTKGPINNIPAMVQIMSWRRPGDKPLSEPMMVCLPTHACVTRPQWVKMHFYITRSLVTHICVGSLVITGSGKGLCQIKPMLTDC